MLGITLLPEQERTWSIDDRVLTVSYIADPREYYLRLPMLFAYGDGTARIVPIPVAGTVIEPPSHRDRLQPANPLLADAELWVCSDEEGLIADGLRLPFELLPLDETDYDEITQRGQVWYEGSSVYEFEYLISLYHEGEPLEWRFSEQVLERIFPGAGKQLAANEFFPDGHRFTGDQYEQLCQAFGQELDKEVLKLPWRITTDPVGEFLAWPEPVLAAGPLADRFDRLCRHVQRNWKLLAGSIPLKELEARYDIPWFC